MYYGNLFHYDERTGILRWKSRPLSDFTTLRGHSVYEAKIAGTEAGGKKCQKNGDPQAIYIRVDGKKKAAHRVVWEMMCGQIPDGMQVDHIDRDPFNNAWSNLRLATPAQNSWNTRHRRHSISALKGIRWNGYAWVARIGVNRKRLHLGLFPTKGLAAVAYAKAALRYHGKFSPVLSKGLIAPR